jgi:hypothetical protein
MSLSSVQRDNNVIRNHTKNSKAKVGLFRVKNGLRVKGGF